MTAFDHTSELSRNRLHPRGHPHMPRRSSTADTSHDRVHRRSPRGVWGRADLQGVADRPIHLSRPCRKAGRSRQAIGAREAGCDWQEQDQACLRGELRRLRRAQGLAAIAPRGRGYRPMHRGATDAEHGPARRDPRQAGQNHDQRQGRAVSRWIMSTAGSGRTGRTHSGSRTSPMSRPGPASSTSRS